MRQFTAAAAALVLATTPALAQETASTNDTMATETDWAELIRSRDIIGGSVYTTNEAYDDDSWGGEEDDAWGWSDYDAVDTDWTQIGEIEDIVLSRSGDLIGVVAEVGGFLDLGDKHVMLRVGDVDLVPIDDQSYSLITRFSEEELETMPGVDEGWWE